MTPTRNPAGAPPPNPNADDARLWAKELAQSQGFRWSPEFADALARIWNGQFVAAKMALDTKGIVFHPVSGAHHAGFSRGSGFCTFNFLFTAFQI